MTTATHNAKKLDWLKLGILAAQRWPTIDADKLKVIIVRRREVMIPLMSTDKASDVLSAWDHVSLTESIIEKERIYLDRLDGLDTIHAAGYGSRSHTLLIRLKDDEQNDNDA